MGADRVEDWLSEEGAIDWVGEPEPTSPEPAAAVADDPVAGESDGAAAAGPTGAALDRSRRLDLIRRRRIVGLAVVTALILVAVAVPVVILGGGGGKAAGGPTTPAATPTAPAPTAGTTPTTSSTPQTTPAATPLKLTLPARGTLRRGDGGSDVKALQKALTALGFTPGAADGVYGPATTGAVVDFQTSSKLQADGTVGAKTVAALNAALAEKGVTG